MQDQSKPKRVVIIGGGITGLAAAYKLLELQKQSGQQLDLTILESSPRLGGALKTEERDGFLLEGGADSFISEKPQAINLAKRLGIESRLIETNQQHRRSFIVRKGKLLPVPEGFQLMAPSRLWPFVTTNIFSWRGKARMALDLFIQRRHNLNGGDDESLANFVRRRLGNEAFERMAQPMIGGIYTADPERLSLRATLPRFLEMEREHRSVIRAMWRARRQSKQTASGVSGARYSLFLSFDRGLQVLVNELAAHVSNFTRLDCKVQSLRREDNEWIIELSDKSRIKADAVCLAVPAYVAASLLKNADAELAALLNQIPFASTATINLGFRRADVPHPLDGFGFVVPFIENKSILACTFSSMKFPNRALVDHVLLRAFVGGALQPELFELAEPELILRARKDLKDLLGITAPPLITKVEKWKNSMPQYYVGHLDLVSQIRKLVASQPGLELAGNSYDGTGIPDCIRSGEAAAEKLVLQAASLQMTR
ncbi:MAG TPA: protoporphyrinogen oxidase [Pyrinomonadaceae bacterium]|nr:protoporphyrinogen oxidase [Pyrinomonadaceae bacterium]